MYAPEAMALIAENPAAVSVLSIDAWRNCDGGWDWNNWYKVGSIDPAVCDMPARQLRRYRRNGYPVSILARGQEWEIGEPEGCMMVPDDCGTLAIRHDTYECRECGSACETRDAAAECCAECYS